ncbi:MAG: hypothetical protein Q8N73_01885 [bacterium]|nr:hypothetical protein [bacterium]
MTLTIKKGRNNSLFFVETELKIKSKLSTDYGENKTCLPLTSLVTELPKEANVKKRTKFSSSKGKGLMFMVYDKFFTLLTYEDPIDEDANVDEEEKFGEEVPEKKDEDEDEDDEDIE